jgi:hypothetical protein
MTEAYLDQNEGTGRDNRGGRGLLFDTAMTRETSRLTVRKSVVFFRRPGGPGRTADRSGTTLSEN